MAAQVTRSSGFAYDRDFRTVTVSSRTTLGAGTSPTVGFVDKAFGADGFYGAAASKERTTLWTAGLKRSLVKRDSVSISTWVSCRTHRDQFRWNVTRPGFFKNIHRTQAVEAGVRGSWRLSERTELGAVAEAAADRIRSTNLGNHGLARAGSAVSLQQRIGAATVVEGALRVDVYSTFGAAANPEVGVSRWLTPAWRVRSSAGRAFRVPTFTERFYRDPAHDASAALDPERAWTLDAAADWLPAPSWQGTISVFQRWEHGVIDWIRATPAEKWRTTNIRTAETHRFEVGIKRWTALGASVGVDYTRLSTNAGAIGGESKYTLDYARHSVVVSGAVTAPGAVTAGVRVEGRARFGRAPYALVDLRLSRSAGGARVFLDATNLFGANYEEVRGVAMPGRWLAVGVELIGKGR